MSVHQFVASDFNSYLIVTFSIYIPHLQLIIYKSYNPMLLVTAISILTGPNTLTVLLEYMNLFNLNHNDKY